MIKEIGGSRDWLVKECGLSSKDVTGYRSTYLTSNTKVRQVKKPIVQTRRMSFIADIKALYFTLPSDHQLRLL